MILSISVLSQFFASSANTCDGIENINKIIKILKNCIYSNSILIRGNGVNTSTWTGLQLAKWLGKYGKSNKKPRDLPRIVHGLSPKFPLSALRRHYLQGMIQLYRFKDALRDKRN